MMNNSWRARARESSRKAEYGFQRGDEDVEKKTGKKRAAVSGGFEVDNREASNRVTGATRCPNEDELSHRRESLIDRKRTISFSFRLPCRPLAERAAIGREALRRWPRAWI